MCGPERRKTPKAYVAASGKFEHLVIVTLRNKNSSGDEIANVNFFYNIAHVEASAYAH